MKIFALSMLSIYSIALGAIIVQIKHHILAVNFVSICALLIVVLAMAITFGFALKIEEN